MSVTVSAGAQLVSVKSLVSYNLFIYTSSTPANGGTTCTATVASGQVLGTCTAAGTTPCAPPGAPCVVSSGATACAAATVLSGGAAVLPSFSVQDQLGNPVVQLIFRWAGWVVVAFAALGIGVGLYALARVFTNALLGKPVPSGGILTGVQGPSTVKAVAEIALSLMGLILVITGGWMPLINAIAGIVLRVFDSIVNTLGGVL